jgi:hypothetical protein
MTEQIKQHLVALPIHPMGVGTSYSPNTPLPLHCTVMHWFKLGPNNSIDQLNNELTRLAGEIRGESPLRLISSLSSLFGSKNDVPVFVLERNPDLEILHTKLLLFLAAAGCLLTELRWVGAGYRPHVATVGRYSFPAGQSYSANEIVLVEKGVGGVKTVLSTRPIGKKT